MHHLAPADAVPQAMDIDEARTTSSLKVAEKPTIEEVEVANPDKRDWDDRDTTLDVDAHPGFWGKLFKQNPSKQFMDDVADMNTTELNAKEVKRIERKIDLLIMPCLAVCYATTLSYAAIFGIKDDLHLNGEQYVLGWLAWALPTNLLMQKFPINKYLAFNIFLWGVFLMAQAASKNFIDMAVLRTISGAAEATADPAFVMITGMWYTRAQQPRRIGYWYSANGFGIAIGGLLGYGIGQINGGEHSWKYEFIIIGALCCIWAVAMFFFVPDSPHLSKWFTRKERLTILSRKRNDYAGKERRQWDASQTYLFFLFGLTANIPNGGTSNFGTLIVKGFGFDTLQTTLMQIPYGIIIVLFILFAIFGNERLPEGSRTWMMVFTNIPTVLGFALIAFTENKGLRLLATVRITGASNATFVVGLSLVSGNVGGQTKKALATAAVFLGVAAGNIIGPFLFFDSEAPQYRSGIIACLTSRAVELTRLPADRDYPHPALHLWRANRIRDRAVAEGRLQYDKEALDKEDLSDWKNPAFRYVLFFKRCCTHTTQQMATSGAWGDGT
ncbi:major facilitator superfamily domain-containing protein [Schizophyllum amplum]|uniref:Major facilitator superfamily domain-containing protein n=1 Tax=Schizophyllum amplum TaxID=97359 RepID=A0A550BYF5_9AGAR|nr:major facilitator superfamily domain-containing protein [Auriculariopsis ampla]